MLVYEPTNGVYYVMPSNRPNDFFFCSDFPSVMVAELEKDLMEETNKGFRSKFILIRTSDYIGTGYEWLSFTLAMHALILTPDDIKVVISDESAASLREISDRIDAARGRRMQCFKNFAIYTNVVKDNRAPRVYLKNKNTGRDLVSCYDEIRNESYGRFSPYYEKWLREPFCAGAFFTHPFDHLPVRNIGLAFDEFKTKKQWEKDGRRVVDDNDYLLAHPQMENVCLKRYYSYQNTRPAFIKKGCERNLTFQNGARCPFVPGVVAGDSMCRRCGGKILDNSLLVKCVKVL